MLTDLNKDKEEASLELRDQEGRDLFKIGAKGEIYWHKPGEDELTLATTDEELGKAMALVILQISGMDYMKLIGVYLGENTDTFKSILLKKIMEAEPKSKSIKKVTLEKIISEFKV